MSDGLQIWSVVRIIGHPLYNKSNDKWARDPWSPSLKIYWKELHVFWSENLSSTLLVIGLGKIQITQMPLRSIITQLRQIHSVPPNRF